MSNDARQEQKHRERLASWVEAHGRAVRGYLWAMSGSHEDADELFQEVFTRAWAARQRYEEQGTPIAYLLRIADRLLIDRARKKSHPTLNSKQWIALEPSDNGELPEQKLIRQEAARKLEVAMNELTDAQRRVLLLHYYGDLPFREIAGIMNCPLNTVLSHARRGIQRLKQIL